MKSQEIKRLQAKIYKRIRVIWEANRILYDFSDDYLHDGLSPFLAEKLQPQMSDLQLPEDAVIDCLLDAVIQTLTTAEYRISFEKARPSLESKLPTIISNIKENWLLALLSLNLRDPIAIRAFLWGIIEYSKKIDPKNPLENGCIPTYIAPLKNHILLKTTSTQRNELLLRLAYIHNMMPPSNEEALYASQLYSQVNYYISRYEFIFQNKLAEKIFETLENNYGKHDTEDESEEIKLFENFKKERDERTKEYDQAAEELAEENELFCHLFFRIEKIRMYTQELVIKNNDNKKYFDEILQQLADTLKTIVEEHLSSSETDAQLQEKLIQAINQKTIQDEQFTSRNSTAKQIYLDITKLISETFPNNDTQPLPSNPHQITKHFKTKWARFFKETGDSLNISLKEAEKRMHTSLRAAGLLFNGKTGMM